MEPITKIIGEPEQGDKNILEAELTKLVIEIKTTEEMVEKGHF